MRVNGVGLLWIAIAGTLLLGSPAGATAASQGPWALPAADLTPSSTDAYQPQLAISPDDTVTAIWRRGAPAQGIIETKTRVRGSGIFTAPGSLSTFPGDAADPQLAASPDGTVTAVWMFDNGSNRIVQTRSRPPGGSFGPVTNLTAAGQNGGSPQVAASPDGTVTVVWQGRDASKYVIQARTRPPGGSFGPVTNLSAPGQHAFEPQVAAAPDGTVTAAWYRINEGGSRIIQVSTRPSGGSFGPAVNLSGPGRDAVNPRIAAAHDGTVTVVWLRYNGSEEIVQARSRPPGSSFGALTNLSAAGGNAYEPELAVSPDGTVTAIWSRIDENGVRIVQAATRPPGGAFGPPANLSAPGLDAVRPHLAAAPNGTVAAIWGRSDGTNWIIQAAVRPPGGSFGPISNLSAAGQSAGGARLVASSDGGFTAIWSSFYVLHSTVQATFTLPPVALRVELTGAGSGTVSSSPAGIECGADCSEEYLPSTVVTLTASPDANSAFSGWSGACSGAAPTCTLAVGEASQVAAEFNPEPKPSTPPSDLDPPDGGTAVYDPANGKLKIRLKCGRQYRPKCLRMVAWGVTGRRKKARAMTSKAKARNRRAGSSIQTTLKVKPEFRQQVEKMGQGTGKSLRVRIRITFRKKSMLKVRRRGRVRKVVRRVKRVRTVHHRYRVLVRS